MSKELLAGKVKCTIGTDPEFMLRDITTGGIVSAIPVLKHGKEGKVFLDPDKKFAIYCDNTMAECNVPPATSEDEFVDNIRKLFYFSNTFLDPARYTLATVASHNFTKAECANEIAMIFGCSPEYCAWTFSEKTPPDGAAGKVFRSAGGHIHIGRVDFASFDEGEDGVFLMDFASKAELIQVCDATVGLALAYLDNDPTAAARKALYGEAGRHRLPIYGVEYRTPGNYWLSSPSLTRLTYKLVELAINICESGKGKGFLAQYAEGDSEDLAVRFNSLIRAVNTNDKAYAGKMLAKTLPSELWKEVVALRNLVPPAIPTAWALGDGIPDLAGVQLVRTADALKHVKASSAKARK